MLTLIRLCRLCEGGMGASSWPDGGALLDQPVKLVEAFGKIRALARFYEHPKGAL